jgi:hypothetical protein
LKKSTQRVIDAFLSSFRHPMQHGSVVIDEHGSVVIDENSLLTEYEDLTMIPGEWDQMFELPPDKPVVIYDMSLVAPGGYLFNTAMLLSDYPKAKIVFSAEVEKSKRKKLRQIVQAMVKTKKRVVLLRVKSR